MPCPRANAALKPENFGGIGPLELVAHTLRLFRRRERKSRCENRLMARDAGVGRGGSPLIAIGGSGRGADTALLLTPNIPPACSTAVFTM